MLRTASHFGGYRESRRARLQQVLEAVISPAPTITEECQQSNAADRRNRPLIAAVGRQLTASGTGMSNDEVYAGGLLNRALDPATQPAAIRDFLQQEFERLREIIGQGRRVVDFGCGTGRHLAALGPRLALGVGLDHERAYIAAAAGSDVPGPVHFVVADATRAPLRPQFDLAICMTNTWGTMPDKASVLREMRRVAPDPGCRVISVYAPTSVEVRREWYARLGQTVTAETAEYLVTAEGFRSEHFTIGRLRSLLGPCEIEIVGEVGLLAVT